MFSEEFKALSKSEIEMYLASNEIDKKIHALIRIVDDVDDWEWIQEKLLLHIHDENFWVAKNAVTGLGDLARVHEKLDLKKVITELKGIKREDLKGSINDVLDDIDIFLKK